MKCILRVRNLENQPVLLVLLDDQFGLRPGDLSSAATHEKRLTHFPQGKAVFLLVRNLAGISFDCFFLAADALQNDKGCFGLPQQGIDLVEGGGLVLRATRRPPVPEIST